MARRWKSSSPPPPSHDVQCSRPPVGPLAHRYHPLARAEHPIANVRARTVLLTEVRLVCEETCYVFGLLRAFAP